MPKSAMAVAVPLGPANIEKADPGPVLKVLGAAATLLVPAFQIGDTLDGPQREARAAAREAEEEAKAARFAEQMATARQGAEARKAARAAAELAAKDAAADEKTKAANARAEAAGRDFSR
jgi:hypothetical protein